MLEHGRDVECVRCRTGKREMLKSRSDSLGGCFAGLPEGWSMGQGGATGMQFSVQIGSWAVRLSLYMVPAARRDRG